VGNEQIRGGLLTTHVIKTAHELKLSNFFRLLMFNGSAFLEFSRLGPSPRGNVLE